MYRWLIPIIFLALAQIACAQDCMGITPGITGQVVDAADGHPIEAATVTVYGNWEDLISFPERITIATNAQGWFTVDDVFTYECATFSIDATAAGYRSIRNSGPYTVWMTYGDFQEDIVITLTREN